MNSQIPYDLRELEIAKDSRNPAHVMPAIAEEDWLILDIGCGIGQTLSAYKLGQGQLPIAMDMDFESGSTDRLIALSRNWMYSSATSIHGLFVTWKR